jgi:CubicO group peptidase (beta-lactamase class C family)
VGSRYQYNSQNYRVLSLLVEQVSGQSYPDYLRDHIFAPLGMLHSAAGPDLAPGLAQGHGQVFGLPFPRPQVFQPAGLGSGYLISSAEDMGKYMIAMLSQGRYAGQTLVQAQSFIQMMTPPEAIKSEYGMGWVITTTTGGKKLVYHGGSIANFHSMVMLLPEERLGMAFLSNQNGILPMLTGLQAVKVGLLNLLVGEPVPQSAFYDWIYWLLAAIVALDLGTQIYRIIRLPQWLRTVSRQPALVRWLRALVDLIVPAALFFGLPTLSTALDGSASWPSAYDLIPDVTLWLLTSFTLSVVRGAAKLVLISRREGPATVSVVLSSSPATPTPHRKSASGHS